MNLPTNHENVALPAKALHLMNGLLEHPRLLAGLLALFAFCVAAASVLLTAWLQLNPCYLCIVQRSLVSLVALFLVLAVVIHRRVVSLVLLPLTGLLALGGMIAAAFQSYEQWYPAQLSCLASQPNILEKTVDWLGVRYPSLFLATGFCEDKELEIIGLSLANWSFLCFSLFVFGAFWLLRLQVRQSGAEADGRDNHPSPCR